MNTVAVGDSLVRVGAGTRTGQLSERPFEHGPAVPTGTCPSVGMAGLTLGGGLGILGQAHGLTLDRLAGAQIVLVDGTVLQCDEDHHAELFWALRGAGAGNFGVITSFMFKPLPAPPMTNFHLVWPYRDAAAVIAAWQQWAPRTGSTVETAVNPARRGACGGPPLPCRRLRAPRRTPRSPR